MKVFNVLDCDEPFSQMEDLMTSELGEMWFSRNQFRLTKEQPTTTATINRNTSAVAHGFDMPIR